MSRTKLKRSSGEVGDEPPPLSAAQEKVVAETLRRLGGRWEDSRESDPDTREVGWERDSQWVGDRVAELELHLYAVRGNRPWPKGGFWRLSGRK